MTDYQMLCSDTRLPIPDEIYELTQKIYEDVTLKKSTICLQKFNILEVQMVFTLGNINDRRINDAMWLYIAGAIAEKKNNTETYSMAKNVIRQIEATEGMDFLGRYFYKYE